MPESRAQVNPDGTVETWDVAAGTYTVSRDGSVLLTRGLTAAEVEWVESGGGSVPTTVDPARVDQLRQLARQAIAGNDAFLDLPAPTYPLGVAAQQALVGQVKDLTRQVSALIRIVVGRDLLRVPPPGPGCPAGSVTPATAGGSTGGEWTWPTVAPVGPDPADVRILWSAHSMSGTGQMNFRLYRNGTTSLYAPGVTLDHAQLAALVGTINFAALPVGDPSPMRLEIVRTSGDVEVQWKNVCLNVGPIPPEW